MDQQTFLSFTQSLVLYCDQYWWALAQQWLPRKMTKDLSKRPRNFKYLLFKNKKKKKVILSWDTTKLDKSHSQRGRESKKAASLNGSIYLWSPSAGPRMQSACQDQRRHSAIGNRREPSLLQGRPSPVRAAQDKGWHIQQPPRGTATAPSQGSLQDTFFLHLSWAPHTNLSTLLRQDFKALRSLFPQAFEFSSQLLFCWFFFVFFLIHISFPIPIHSSCTELLLTSNVWFALNGHLYTGMF